MLAGIAALTTSALTVSLLAAPSEAKPRKTRVKADLTASATNPGGSVAMVGKVKDKGDRVRTVVLEQKIAGGWRKVGKAKTAATGDYAITVPTHWFYSSKLRVRVKKTKKFRGDASRPSRMKVVPPYAPLGSKSSWKPISNQGLRLNPCKTITYGINTSRATPDPATAAAAVNNAVALVAQATGMRFKYVGETSAAPFDRKFKKKDPTLVLAWTTDADTPLDLGGNVAARGGSDRSRWARNAKGKRIAEMTSTGVLFDLDDTAIMTGTQIQQLAMHEVGHAMGLGHVGPTDQYMTAGAELYDLPVVYQAGDLNGLSKVGLQAGCLRPIGRRGKTAAARVPAPVDVVLD